MPTELRWKVSLSATCLHAARCRRAGLAAADAALAASLDGPADALCHELAAAGWPISPLLDQLGSLAAEHDNNQQLVNRALAKLRIKAAGAPITLVAGAISDLEAALRVDHAELADELPLRMRPLREQWEARGPGMLQEMGRLTDPAIIPAAAEIVLVAPYAGGHGAAFPLQNRVVFEAVLVNPVAELPEIQRLSWLIAQLNSDLPLLTDALPAVRAAATMPLATLPAVLAAGEAVELGRCDQASLAKALDAWRPPIQAPAAAAEQLWTWWNTWLDRSTTWPVAVAALDAMLKPAGNSI